MDLHSSQIETGEEGRRLGRPARDLEDEIEAILLLTQKHDRLCQLFFDAGEMKKLNLRRGARHNVLANGTVSVQMQALVFSGSEPQKLWRLFRRGFAEGNSREASATVRAIDRLKLVLECALGRREHGAKNATETAINDVLIGALQACVSKDVLEHAADRLTDHLDSVRRQQQGIVPVELPSSSDRLFGRGAIFSPPRPPPEVAIMEHDPPIGRDAACAQIISDLTERRGVLLFGAPGQGKTTLARYVAFEVGDQFPQGVCEVSLESERQVENLPRLIGAALGMADLPSSYELLRDRSMLLILDSVDQILRHASLDRLDAEFDAILRGMPSDARLIVTSQPLLEKSGLATREVGPLAADPALELFHRMSDSQYRQDRVIDLEEFVLGKLGGHPLSIQIVARYGRSIALPLEELRRLWGEKWTAIAKRGGGSLDNRGLQASFDLTFDALPPPAKFNFLVLGLLPDGMSPALVRGIWPEQETEIYDALRILRDRSLLEDNEQARKLNRLRGPLYLFATAKLVEIAQSDDPIAPDLAAARARIDAWFDRYIAANAPQFSDAEIGLKNQLIRDQFHNIHATLDRRLVLSTDRATLAAAESVLSLYWAYHNNLSGARNPISSTEDAIRYLEKAHSILLANDRSAAATRCTYYIGNIHWLRGDIPRAQSYLQEAEGSDDVSEELACEIQRAFAHIEYKEGDIASAVTRYLAVADRAQRFPGCAFRCWVGLLDAYRKLECFEEGFALIAEVERHMEECPPQVVGNVRRGHAYLLFCAGQQEAAEAEYRAALAAFSHNDFGQAHCWRGLGDIFVRRGDFALADDAFGTALRLYDEARKNPSLGVALIGLGRVRLMLAQGDLDSAMVLLADTAQSLDREHLNEPYEFAVAHELMGEILAASGEDDRARAEFNIAVKYFTKVGATAVADRIKLRLT